MGADSRAEAMERVLRDTFRVRVLHNGQPFPNFVVGAVGPGTTAAKFFKTDANGYAVVELPRAGLWLLNGTDLRRTERKGLEWESDYTTLTIAVNARRFKILREKV